LTTTDRQALRRLGVRVGRHVVFVPALGRPAAVRARVALVNAFLGPGVQISTPEPSAVSLRVTVGVPRQLYAAVGYPAFGVRAIRADHVDQVGMRLLGGAPANDVASRLGCSTAEIAAIRLAFGDTSRNPQPSRESR
jgi:ATP-dependent RNA helicase SUPV3L1/SUV3